MNSWPYRRMSPEARFWARVNKTPTCWLWIGHTRGGYGRFQVNGSKVAAHRFAYELLVGAIPTGMQLDHTCHNPPCVNPEHLRAVTSKQNQENQGRLRTDNSSGYRGVRFVHKKKRWEASVTHYGEQLRLGLFKSAEEANAAAVAKRIELYTHNDMDRGATG